MQFNCLIYFKDAGEESVCNIDVLRNKKGEISTADLRLKMQKTMQNHAAVFREDATLVEGVKKMQEVYDMYKLVNIKDK